MFVVVDPQWGDPQPIPDTEAATAEEAIEKAIRHPDHALWSGASDFPLPHGTPGKWSRLQEQGYRVLLVKDAPEGQDHDANLQAEGGINT